MNLSRSRLLVAGLSVGVALLSWLGLAHGPAGGRLFGLYSMRAFVFLVAISYLALWIVYGSVSRERLSVSAGKCLLTTASIAFILGLLELPALLGLLDYRRYVSLPESTLFTRIKIWENPGNRLDRELLHVHRPGQEITGETVGDLVHWLKISTDRRYPVEIKYDRLGFRNDHDIEQAPVVVIGDSFAESGLVGREDLISSRLARRLGLEVANLGQSGYGPQQELIVLRRYGLKLQPRLVLWLFFEGNDLRDLRRYDRVMESWDDEMSRLHGARQRTLSLSVLRLLTALTEPPVQQDQVMARRRSCTVRHPLTDESTRLYFAFAGEPLTEQDRTSLRKTREILLQADRLCNDSGARLVLVYVPTKFRVYQNTCEYPDESDMTSWRVNDLPQQMESWAAEHGISYVDLVRPLQEGAGRGELVFFQDDGHWNARGNEIATETILDYLERAGPRDMSP